MALNIRLKTPGGVAYVVNLDHVMTMASVRLPGKNDVVTTMIFVNEKCLEVTATLDEIDALETAARLEQMIF